MKKGEIWFVDLLSTKGHEQEGFRPAIVVAVAEANICLVIPCTSNIQTLRFPHTVEISPSKKNGLETISVGLIFQLRAIDRTRLKRRIGELEEEKVKEINSIVKKLLQL